jgi:hypothetical protein
MEDKIKEVLAASNVEDGDSINFESMSKNTCLDLHNSKGELVGRIFVRLQTDEVIFLHLLTNEKIKLSYSAINGDARANYSGKGMLDVQ